jgi:hypothetical protein
MKKIYTLTAVIFASGLAFSQVNNSQNKWQSAMYGTPEKVSYKLGTLPTDKQEFTGNGAKTKPSGVSNRAADHSAFITLGETYYDLQSNAAMPHRLVKHANGNISATWTTASSDAAGFPGRGAGYNMFNASTAQWGNPTSEKVEATQRSGWPNVGVLSDGNTFVIGHDANSGGFYMTKSTSPGQRPSETVNILTQAPYKPIWGRTDNSGDTIHLICAYTDSAAPGESRPPLINGVRGPMVYSRSFDGGSTWNKAHTVLPGYDSTLFNAGSADNYAIDVRGENVAIATSAALSGVVVWKSSDAGETWRRYLADSFPYAPFTGKKFMIDTPFTSDGTVDVLIDNDGKVHAFWGLTRVLDEDTTDESYSFFPGFQGLVYWNESMASGENALIASGGSFDRDGDGINALTAANTQALQEGNVPAGLATVARLGNTSALRQPSAAIDANNRIFVTFSIPIEGDESFLSANFRDIGIVHSTDGGMTWENTQNITQFYQKEDDFACVAREVDDFLHVMWQQDEIPGTNLQNNSTLMANHEVVLNTIMYTAIPVASILTGEIGHMYGINNEKIGTGNVFVVGQNFPNPFGETSNVAIYLSEPGNVTLEVRNTMGALVQTKNHKGLLRGNHILEIAADGLSNGIYTYTVISGGRSETKSMMIAR